MRRGEVSKAGDGKDTGDAPPWLRLRQRRPPALPQPAMAREGGAGRHIALEEEEGGGRETESGGDAHLHEDKREEEEEGADLVGLHHGEVVRLPQ